MQTVYFPKPRMSETETLNETKEYGSLALKLIIIEELKTNGDAGGRNTNMKIINIKVSGNNLLKSKKNSNHN